MLGDMSETRAGFRIIMVFFLQAAASGGLFARIPDVQTKLGLGEAELGFVLMALPVGSFAVFPFAGWANDRFGTRIIIIWAVVLLAFMPLIFALAPSPLWAAMALFFIGASFSFSNVTMNVEADRVEASLGRLIMNRCHGFWSFGFLVASLFGAMARAWEVPPWVQFALVFPLVAAAVAWLVVPMNQAPPRNPGQAEARIKLPLPSRATFGILAFGFGGSMVHGATNNWSVIYMRDLFDAPDWLDAMTIPAFLIALTGGRMVADRLIERFGHRPMAIASVLVAIAGLANVLIAGGVLHGLFGFMLMGLGTAAHYPMMATAAGRLTDRPAAENMAAVTMTMAIGMLAVPGVMGLAADAVGIRLAFLVLVPFLLLSFASIDFIAKAQLRR
jgi:MFS family permease